MSALDNKCMNNSWTRTAAIFTEISLFGTAKKLISLLFFSYSLAISWYLPTLSGGRIVTTMWLCQCHCEKVCELPNCIYWREGKFLIDSLLPPRKEPLNMAENNFLVLLFKRENSRGARFRWIDVGCSATSISENPEPWSFLRIPSIPATLSASNIQNTSTAQDRVRLLIYEPWEHLIATMHTVHTVPGI